MQEFGLLISELDGYTRPTTTTAKRKTAETSSLVEWKAIAAAAMAETGSDTSRLPTIREDKAYPRRTLGTEEIRDIVNASESPDIGPPPVAHFPDEDPIKFDQPSVQPPSKVDDDLMPDDLSNSLSVNLETRRKRRDGQPRIDIRRMSIFPSPSTDESSDVPTEPLAPSLSQVLPIRAGAKRKLSAREVEEKQDTVSVAPPEGFQFSRRGASTKNEGQIADETKGAEKERRAPTPGPPNRSTTRSSQLSERKVLGTKSVNTDPVNSPKKQPKEKPSDDVMDLKKSLAVTAFNERQIRDRKTKAAQTSQPQAVVEEIPQAPVPVVDIVLDAASLPPKTPAAADLFSPPSTESFAPPRDTPEPGMTHGDLQAAASRPGRRARSQVNYAEPSLNTKMRRPGKELADAVGRDARSIAIRADRTVKQERQDDDMSGNDWISLPTASATRKDNGDEAVWEANSPLRNKVAASRALQEQHATDSEPQPTEQHTECAAPDVPSHSGPASITSAMRKRLGRPSQVLPAVVADAALEGMTDEKRDSLAIFDFNESSPHNSQPSSSEKLQSAPDSSKLRASRRHSSVPSMITAQNTDPAVEKTKETLVRSKTMKDLTRSSSRIGTPGTAETLSAARRERAAARRNSMMF